MNDQTERDERDAKFFHDGWMAALREVRMRSDRQIGEFLVEQLGEPTETEEVR